MRRSVDVAILDFLERDESGDYLANFPPAGDQVAPLDLLKNPLKATLFKVYIEHAGPWLDVISPSQYFALTVPRLAISNPVLLCAWLSYSSKTLFPSIFASE